MKIKILILSIALFTINACKQKDIHSNVNSSTSIKEGKDMSTHNQKTSPTPTAEQLEMMKSVETKIEELSPEDKKRYQSFTQEIKDAKTGPELAKVIEKYKDLKKKIR